MRESVFGNQETPIPKSQPKRIINGKYKIIFKEYEDLEWNEHKFLRSCMRGFFLFGFIFVLLVLMYQCNQSINRAPFYHSDKLSKQIRD
jgi:hypothetical protein